ncbi:hypothetical protein [Paenibacillus silvae]|uniref:hypothetical protein n=1 Tax=Paenibacillus silvae TaxID=1325358 RepID=UPI0020056D2E|nr:hypothetical protein [Paenibacillus silvae]MCK6076259.1 hypothetical protein [Paenibacillus silvae]MCK6150582.1 hypothetical protein [Paenibacillus silvae]MCK6268842.1 hypothetical protein [Paenibacillus silvae]MCK6270435.1 hypothetical protein [Paenibacillus silvae]
MSFEERVVSILRQADRRKSIAKANSEEVKTILQNLMQRLAAINVTSSLDLKEDLAVETVHVTVNGYTFPIFVDELIREADTSSKDLAELIVNDFLDKLKETASA